MKKYIRASFDSSIPDWLRKDRYAIKALNEAGIDLANCKFSSEKRGKVGDNYVIYLVKGSHDFDSYAPFVWIPDLYNDDKDVPFKNWNKLGWDDDGKRHYGAKDYKAVKYTAKKNLNVIDTVYVYKDTNKKPYKKDRYVDPRYDEYGNYLGQQVIPGKWHYEGDEKVSEPGHWSKQGVYYGSWNKYPEETDYRDKSGYKIPNPKDRLRKFYETKEGMSKQVGVIRNNLDSIYTQLEDVKEKVFNSVLPRGEREDYRRYSNLYEYLERAIGYYENALNLLEKLDKYGIRESWESSHNISDALRDLKRAQGYIDDLNRMLNT